MMAKKKGFFDFVKKIFGSDSKSKHEKKERRKRWLFGKLKSRRSITLPALSSGKGRTLRQAEDEQTKHALAVAVATAAAAEVAVAAAQAAAEVVRLTGTPLSYNKNRDIAAIKIQAAFRGYLARKALRALKGLVKLQALIRGRAVRRQTSATLKSLQSLMNIQQQVRAQRLRMSEDEKVAEGKGHRHQKSTDLGDTYSNRNEKRWDSSSLSKEEIKAIIINRQEATLRRERAMEYASSQQHKINPRRYSLCMAQGLEADRMNRRLSWLEQWMGNQPWDKDVQDALPVPSPSPARDYLHQRHHSRDALVFDKLQRSMEELPQFKPTTRRSFNRPRQSFVRDDESVISSPAFPNFMAFTESAKARARSTSTPRQRVGAMDFIHQNAPHTNRLSSPFPSISTEHRFGKSSRVPASHPRSPSLKY